jgi:hypothetical protein
MLHGCQEPAKLSSTEFNYWEFNEVHVAVLLEKLTVAVLVKLPAYYRNLKFITVSTRARHRSLT